MASKKNSTLDLNTASREELVAAGVSGRGADALISRRNEVGSLASHDELEGIPGLSGDAAEVLRRVTTVQSGDPEPTHDAPVSRPERAAEADVKGAAESTATAPAAGPTLVRPASRPSEDKVRIYAAPTGEAAGAVMARTGEAAKQTVDAAASTAVDAAKEALDTTRAGLNAGAAGVERAHELSALWLFWWPEQVSEAVRTATQLATCRTSKEFIELQANFARSSMERFSRLFGAQMGATFGSTGALAGRTGRRVNVY